MSVMMPSTTKSVEEGKPLPNLIITDGGKGQMEVVRQVIEDELHIDIPIAGLAKDDRHRTNELLFGFPPKVVGLKPNSEVFRLLAHIQDGYDIRTSLEDITEPLTTGNITTIGAFLSLLCISAPAMRDFGLSMIVSEWRWGHHA